MIILRTLFLLMLVGLAGCAKPASTGCPGATGPTRQVTLIYNPALIFAAPPIRIVDQGDVIRFKLVGKPGVLVKTEGKSAIADWINKSGDKKEFFVCVPDKPDGDYYYKVKAVGSPTLDPMVRIL